MKRIFPLIACIVALSLAACGSDSKLPNPTGKGTIRAINAIPGSPDYLFLIEERSIASVPFKSSTAPVEYDDFEYVFNFDVRFPGEDSLTRVASPVLKVEADRDYVFLMSGDIRTPTITLWEGDVREWDGTETVFEARFSHASASLGDIDVYFDPAGTVLGTFPPAATLSFGEIADAADFDEGEHQMTITAAGDINTVYFTSQDVSYLPRFAHIVTIFEGDGNNTGPVAVTSMTAVGNPLLISDIFHPSKIRFIHSAFTLEPVDIYDDDILTNRVVANLQFKGATPDMDTTLETKTYYFTPANSTATILFEQEVPSPPPGLFTHFYAIGETAAWEGSRLFPDRAVSLTRTKLLIFNGSENFKLFDVYQTDRGEPLTDDDPPSAIGVTYGQHSLSLPFLPGSYDLHLTDLGTTTVIAGPYEIDVVDGDIIDLIAVDTVDPLTIELVDVPVP